MSAGPITSASNKLVKEAMHIKTRGRAHTGKCLLEGSNLINAALDSGAVDIQEIFYTEGGGEKFQKVLSRARGVRIIEAGENIINRLAETVTPQGIIATASLRQQKHGLPKQGIIIISDGISEPGNLGSIIRTSDAAGAKAVIILPGSCDPYSGKTLRASAGSAFNIPILFMERLECIEQLHKTGFKVFGLASKGKANLFDVAFSGNIAYAFGNESSGLSADVQGSSDMLVSIPMQGRAESLNVAVSAAVVLYEAMRQQGGHKTG